MKATLIAMMLGVFTVSTLVHAATTEKNVSKIQGRKVAENDAPATKKTNHPKRRRGKKKAEEATTPATDEAKKTEAPASGEAVPAPKTE